MGAFSYALAALRQRADLDGAAKVMYDTDFSVRLRRALLRLRS